MTEKAISTLVTFEHLRPEAMPRSIKPATQYRKNPALNFHHSPKRGTDITDNTPFGGGNVSNVSDPNRGMGEFFSDEVTF
jgi:hypothetical protein